MIPVTPLRVHHALVTSGPNAIPTPWRFSALVRLGAQLGRCLPVYWVRDQGRLADRSTIAKLARNLAITAHRNIRNVLPRT